MEGHEIFGISKETAQVVGGAATATGGYLYFTTARGWKMAVGGMTTFTGCYVGYEAVTSAMDAVFGKSWPGISAGLAGTATLGIIVAVRKWSEKLDIAAWIGKRV